MATGYDSPAGILWTSDSGQAAKTISLTPASLTVTIVQTVSQGSSSTSVLPSSESSAQPSSTTRATLSQTSITGSTSTQSALQSITPTPSTKQTTTFSTKISESPSGSTAASQTSTSNSASSYASPSALSSISSSNNIGAIVGGTLGGIALLSFIILALLFLRKYQRGLSSSSPRLTEPSKRGFYLFNIYKKRGAKAPTAGVFEKEADYGPHEKEDSNRPPWGQAHEVQGSSAWKKKMSRAQSLAGGEESYTIQSSPVELPGSSNNFL